MRAVTRGGDAGGLLLTFVLYPLALATLKYGPSGPGIWFRAKWLNQPATTDELLKAAKPSTPTKSPKGRGKVQVR